ncbi:hypothetical protein AFL42_10110 [Oceanobacillus caeni]|uniref:Uncharacterized protein n=1 Tax=Oceanobacillus caeni TaxID=405946 RepID=A0ABR5MIM1_9BACI|nr:hypothetical protein AFL42_10110 [Oceanobacillus caeni]
MGGWVLCLLVGTITDISRYFECNFVRDNLSWTFQAISNAVLSVIAHLMDIMNYFEGSFIRDTLPHGHFKFF